MSGAIETKEPCYCVTLVDRSWHLTRPGASMPHAFDKLDDALTFVSTDCSGAPAIVEIRAEGAYMVKQTPPRR
ncbi:MAG: hypothetical protein JSR91_06185 [Proteobacteria bacterium]|nr:hypothetical protein [Pseudomonadota bacterium]